MSKIGWIALYRKIENHWLWDDKPFSKGQAWIDLLLLANHDDNKFLLGNELISLKKGSFVTSEIKLMERWGWGKGKTRAFLDLLQKDNMIVKQADHRKTIINVVNYERFANFERNNIPPTDYNRTANGPQTDTNNNDNNYNNIYIIQDPALKEAFEQFKEFRKSIKKPLSKNGYKLIVDKLNSITCDTAEQCEILKQSIRCGWRDVFPLSKGKEANKEHDYAGYDLDLVEKMLNQD